MHAHITKVSRGYNTVNTTRYEYPPCAESRLSTPHTLYIRSPPVKDPRTKLKPTLDAGCEVHAVNGMYASFDVKLRQPSVNMGGLRGLQNIGA